MRIIQISQLGSGKRIRGWIMCNAKGEKKFMLEPDQGLENSCHSAVENTMRGRAIERGSWEDNRPPDYEAQKQVIDQ